MIPIYKKKYCLYAATFSIMFIQNEHKICGKSMICFERKENPYDKRNFNSVNYL